MCNRWKNSNHQCLGRGSNPGRLRDRPTLYHVAIKAGLYRKAVQVNHIPITTTYSPSILRFVCECQFEQPLNIRPPSISGHQAHQTGLLTLGARCNRWKNSNHLCRSRGSNPVRWTQSPTLYHVTIKAGLYRKAVQVCYIPIPGDILPLQLEIRPWISRSPRITWNETQEVLCTHVGYLRWVPNVTGEKMEITIFPGRGLNLVRWTQSPTLDHVAIKAGLYIVGVNFSRWWLCKWKCL